MHLSDAENVETGEMCTLEMKFRGGNNTDKKRKSLIGQPQKLVLQMLHREWVQFTSAFGLRIGGEPP